MPHDPKTQVDIAIDELVSWMGAMQAGTPAEDPYLYSFEEVSRRELSEGDKRRINALSVLLVNDEYQRHPTRYDITLTLALEFSYWLSQDELLNGHAATLERVLGEVQRRALQYTRLYPDPTMVDVWLMASERDPGDLKSARVRGVVYIGARVFCALYDPRGFAT